MLTQVSHPFLEVEWARNIPEAIYFNWTQQASTLLHWPTENASAQTCPGTGWLPRKLPDHGTITSIVKRREHHWSPILEMSKLPGLWGIFIAVCFHWYVERRWSTAVQLWTELLAVEEAINTRGHDPCYQEGKPCVCLVCIVSWWKKHLAAMSFGAVCINYQ